MSGTVCDRCGKSGQARTFSSSGDVYYLCISCHDRLSEFMGWTRYHHPVPDSVSGDLFLTNLSTEWVLRLNINEGHAALDHQELMNLDGENVHTWRVRLTIEEELIFQPAQPSKLVSKEQE